MFILVVARLRAEPTAPFKAHLSLRYLNMDPVCLQTAGFAMHFSGSSKRGQKEINYEEERTYCVNKFNRRGQIDLVTEIIKVDHVFIAANTFYQYHKQRSKLFYIYNLTHKLIN